MFNVIPPINGRNVGFAPQKNKFAYSSNNLAPLNADTTSFTGVEKIGFEKICGKFKEADFYLSEAKLAKKLRSVHPDEYMHALSSEVAEIVAKRLDNLGIVKKAESGSFGHPPHLKLYPGRTLEPSTFTFHPKGKPLQRYSMDWSEQYNAIRNVFEKTGTQDPYKATKYNFDAAKNELYAELENLSLI